MKLPTLSLRGGEHNKQQVVQLHFVKNEGLMPLLRSNKNLRWSKTMSCWYLPYQKNIVSELFQLVKGKMFLDYTQLSENKITVADKENTVSEVQKANLRLGELGPEHLEKISEFKNWMRSKRYSESTIGTYTEALKTFLKYFSDKNYSEITNTDLINFNNEYILKNKFSASYQNQVVNGVKLFFSKIESKQLSPELIHRPKRAKVLPNVLSKEEVRAILYAHNNVKHKTMLSLIYSCGLRCGELLRLKPEHVDGKRNLLMVKQGKGRKDRIVPLGSKIIEMIGQYLEACQPKVYLFEGQNKGEPYDERSLQKVLKQSLEKSRISKPVSLHWLRHSYATHLLESGTDLRYIQEILGHSRSTTTEIYTHVSTKGIQNVISPFDTL
jgi:integrase/recombinase XerD